MKTVLSILAAIIVTATVAEPVADYVEGEDSTAILTPEFRTSIEQMMGSSQAATGLLHAISLTMRKYDLDMATESGRQAWHGRLHHETVNTNGLYKIATYTNSVDGSVWNYRSAFKPRPLVTPSRRTVTAYTNGVPSRLAAARLRRAAEINTGTVTTNVVTEAR